MTPNMRRLHWFAIGVHLAGVVLFTWMGLHMFAGWAVFWGALSLTQLRADRKGVAA